MRVYNKYEEHVWNDPFFLENDTYWYNEDETVLFDNDNWQSRKYGKLHSVIGKDVLKKYPMSMLEECVEKTMVRLKEYL